MVDKGVSAHRVAALVGPFSSGKTSLLESLMHAAGGIIRKGNVNDANRIGDASKEAKQRQMSVESVIAGAKYLGDEWTFIDTSGSVEFLQDTYNCLMVADVAVVVIEADPSRIVMATPVLKFLSEHSIPHMIFINKIESKKAPVAEIFEAVKAISDKPLVRRQLPIMEGEDITGYVDLTSERAYKYENGEYENNVSKHVDGTPADMTGEIKENRQEMLEAIADFNDELLEKLLEEKLPPVKEVYEVLKEDLIEGNVIPVFFGSAEQDYGVKRLLKALRHETPQVEKTVERLGLDIKEEPFALVCKTIYAQHTGKMSIARVFAGEITDGSQIAGGKISGLYELTGEKNAKITSAVAGKLAALGKLEEVAVGDVLTLSGKEHMELFPEPLSPLFALSLKAAKKGEEVKLSGSLAKLTECDNSLTIEHNQDTHEMCLWGQGEIHLKVAISKLESRFNVAVEGEKPSVPYKETIRKSTKQQGRYKKQSGGAGQFGDVHIEIKPRPRGEGFEFTNTVVGGSVPKQYIPSVENGVKEYLAKGSLGFPVVDVAVNLSDGSSHAVDSSDQAFKMAGILAMKEGVPNCSPVLLEPIISIEVSMPNDCTSGAQRVISQHRGQILGFEQKPNWDGWDIIKAHLPQSEMFDLIIEIRSLTMGVGTLNWKFDRLQELTGKEADAIVKARNAD